MKKYLNSIGIESSYRETPIDRTLTFEASLPIISSPIVKEKMSVLHEVDSLEQLKKAVESFNECALKKTAINTVFCDGISTAPIMAIGEAPGEEEDNQGRPFVGKSGQLLDKMFASIGLSRKSNLYISNVIFWRPPGNRQPTPQELEQCYPFVEKHILIVKPKIILLLGSVASKTVLKTQEGIFKLRGTWHEFKHPELETSIPVLTFYHPSYLLRSPKQKGVFWRDLLMLKSKLNSIL